jgi:hypothetical protein
MKEVLESVRKVVELSQRVRIHEPALCRFARALLTEGIRLPPWNSQYHFYDGGEKTVAYFLVLDSLNFCFWPQPGQARWEFDHKSTPLSGYHALALSLKAAVLAGVPLDDPGYLEALTRDQLIRILGGRGRLQLMEERQRILNELGRVLISTFRGKARNMVEAAGNSAVGLARLLVRELTSFRDAAEYQRQTVCFYKRAQILSADLYGAFQGRKWGRFRDIMELTAFADYKLPQVLRHLGILRYSRTLRQNVDQGICIDPGSPAEIEIRANTVWAVERLKRELARLGEHLRSFEIDWMLWNLGQAEDFRDKPYHRTVTIFY